MIPVLVLNSGSSSIKYQLLDMADRARLATGVVERIGEAGGAVADHAAGVRQGLAELEGKFDRGALAAVGHRVVDGGGPPRRPAPLDDEGRGGLTGFCSPAPPDQHRP